MSEGLPEQDEMGIDDPELIESFLKEAKEFITAAGSELSQLEGEPEKNQEEKVAKIFRSVHSVKGAAGFLGLKAVYNLAMAMEKMVKLMQSGNLMLNEDNFVFVKTGLENLNKLVSNPGQQDEIVSNEYTNKINNLVAKHSQ